MCIRQASPGLGVGDIQLEPTTRDEVGQYGEEVHRNRLGRFEVCRDGTLLLQVERPVVLKHTEEPDVTLQPGLYKWSRNKAWPGAALIPCHKEHVDG